VDKGTELGYGVQRDTSAVKEFVALAGRPV